LLQAIDYRERFITSYRVQRASHYKLYSTESEILQVIELRERVITSYRVQRASYYKL